MLRKITQNEILKKIDTEELTAIEIILDHKTAHKPQIENRASIIFNDKFFSSGYEIIGGYTYNLLKTIKKAIPDDVLLIYFEDKELPEAWKQAYQDGGILERFPDDRRLKFHPYNEMNEQFCIDQTLLWDITDEFKGTDHELSRDKCIWRWEITQFYKSHLI